MEKKLPVDVSNFRTMIEDGYLYIDKTQIIHQLFSKRRLYFLSRPRRFGKSLLISTLKELFSGNKQLFKNTWLGKQDDYEWGGRPVIHFDFSELSFDTSQEFKSDLVWAIEHIAQSFEISVSKAPSFVTKFKLLIEQLSQKKRVVILIDEYDAPMLNNLDRDHIASAIQKLMKNFFSVIKSCDARGYIHAVFITGVTKFAKTSIFSGLNNLNDITLSPEAAGLLGYTHQELTSYFEPYAHQLSHNLNLTHEQTFDTVKAWYNGYRFSKDILKVYNPYSVVHCFEKNELENYWLESGTPSFLVNLLKNQYKALESVDREELSVDFLGTTFEIGRMPIIPILFQTGYLTIVDYDASTKKYRLSYPNQEVGQSFKKYILEALTRIEVHRVDSLVEQFTNALHNENIEAFCDAFKSLLGNIPYQLHIGKEAYYHSLLHVLIDLLGYAGQSEISTSKGRLDLAITLPSIIYIFEFKFKSTGEKALEQIITQRYYEKYTRFKLPILLAGISFNVKNKELILDYAHKYL